MDASAMGRGMVLNRARSMTRARTGGHYPGAARRARRDRALGRASGGSGLVIEANAVSDLAVGRCARTWCASSCSPSAPRRTRRSRSPRPPRCRCAR
jgi:hypothetical protein